MSELVINKRCGKLKDWCFKMPKISYCSRWQQGESPPTLSTFGFPDPQIQQRKNQKSLNFCQRSENKEGIRIE